MHTRTRSLLRISLGSLIVLHGLAHAVLPFRGIVLYPRAERAHGTAAVRQNLKRRF